MYPLLYVAYPALLWVFSLKKTTTKAVFETACLRFREKAGQGCLLLFSLF
jgi:hypothetical protein